MKKSIRLFLLFTMLSLLACTQEMRQSFGEMFDLRAKLEEKFNAGAPNINLGGTHLAINYINSPLNDLPAETRKIKAREIAVFVVQNYQGISSIENISVVFTVHKNYVVFNYTNGLDSYLFSTKELLAEKSGG